MNDLIDELHNDHIKCSKVLDLLAEQLENIHQDKPADYHLMLDAVSYLEFYSEYALAPKEEALFRESADEQSTDELNNTIQQIHSDCHELKVLTHTIRNYIDAALEDSIFEKDLFEQELDTCIQRQREHIDTEELRIFPMLKEQVSEEQRQKMSQEFHSREDELTADNLSEKYGKLYHRIIEACDSYPEKLH